MAITLLFSLFAILLLVGVPVAYALAAASLATLLYLDLPSIVLVQQISSGTGSASLIASRMVRLGMSISTRSPSRTSPIAPPSAASGETWPIDRPDVPPEKRPSVTSAHALPSPFDFR